MFRVVLVVVNAWMAVPSVHGAEQLDARLDNWHQWRGPLANGTAPHATPPVAWGKTRNIKWKVTLPGESSATPIIWNNQVFVVSAVRTDRSVATLPPPKAEPPGGYKTPRPKAFYRFIVAGLERATGHICWQHVATEAVPHEGHHPTNTYAAASPTTDGQRLFVSFGSQGIFCYDLDGQLLWQRDLGDMVTRYGWGEAISPVVHENRLVVNWDHEGDSFVVVLDTVTGKTIWRADRDEVTSWSTPLVVEHGGDTQLIIAATRRITSYDLESGRVLWECGGLTTNVVPCPVRHENLAICMSGYGRGAARAVRLDTAGDVTHGEQVAWRLERGTPYVPSPLLYDGRLFFTASNRGLLSCVDAATGQPLAAPIRLPRLGNLYASPVGAAGRVYFVDRNGTTLVIKNEPKLTVLAINELDDVIDGSPALVGREFFLRSHTSLYCIAGE